MRLRSSLFRSFTIAYPWCIYSYHPNPDFRKVNSDVVVLLWFRPLKNTYRAVIKSAKPMMIRYNPVSCCWSILKAPHNKILNDLKTIPVANNLAASIPRNNIFISNKTFLNTATSRVLESNILRCMILLHDLFITE